MTTGDLRARGFVRHPWLSTFYGWCWACQRYEAHSWWQTPNDNHQVSACDACDTVEQRDAAWLAPRYPVRCKNERRNDEREQERACR
jgi:hypothetical protein